MNWIRRHKAILGLAQGLMFGYVHADCYLLPQDLSRVDSTCCSCGSMCSCEREDGLVPGGCQITASGCSHSNVQAQSVLMKECILDRDQSVIVLRSLKLLTYNPVADGPIEGFGFSVFHPPIV